MSKKYHVARGLRNVSQRREDHGGRGGGKFRDIWHKRR